MKVKAKVKVKLILFAMLLFVLILSSCNNNQDILDNLNESEEMQTEITEPETETEAQTEITEPINYNINFSEDLKEFKQNLSDGEKTETVLWWDYFSYGRDKAVENGVPAFEIFKEESQMISFVNAYLQERGMFKETPDRIFNGGDIYSAEYYVNSDKRQSSFIIYFSEPVIYYSDNFEETDRFDWHIGCITISWDDFQELGSIVYECDQNGDTVFETAYTEQGEQVTSVSYEYFTGVPFAFISEIESIVDADLNFYPLPVKTIINRNQKFWFYKNLAVFDNTGKMTEYDCYKEILYDEKNRLKEMNEYLNDEYRDWLPECYSSLTFSSFITLDYSDGDKLNKVNYWFLDALYGTADFSGRMNYDEQGRIIYRHFYMTHADHDCFYLYDGEAKRPWAYIEMCGGCNPLSVYLFPNK